MIRREVDRRAFLQSASLAALWSLAPGRVFAQGAAGPSAPWHQRPLRIYHPNPRESELRTLDVKRFVAGCAETQGEAVVISVGGIYAFYPSRVPYHYVSPVVGERDLVGEIANECRAQNLRVIARVDFSKAREEVWRDHPEWFRRDPKDAFVKRDKYYAACPLGGYQNAEFAHPVLREISTAIRWTASISMPAALTDIATAATARGLTPAGCRRTPLRTRPPGGHSCAGGARPSVAKWQTTTG